MPSKNPMSSPQPNEANSIRKSDHIATRHGSSAQSVQPLASGHEPHTSPAETPTLEIVLHPSIPSPSPPPNPEPNPTYLRQHSGTSVNAPTTQPPFPVGHNGGRYGVDDSRSHHSDSKLPGPPKYAAPSLDQNTAFWNAYNLAADIEDKELVKTFGGDLDVLLIFAGLFSATNTAFIIESYKSLKADPVDETNQLLRALLQSIQNPSLTTTMVDQPSFTPVGRDVRINFAFFASLCCSLSAAFGAVLAKQWLTQYDGEDGGTFKTPSARGQQRQQKLMGRNAWRLEDVVATLPTLLQFSLFLFLVGLVDFMWPLSTPVASLVIGFTIATFLFYAITISISVIDPGSPFQTRLSATFRSYLPFVRKAANLPIDTFIDIVYYILDIPEMEPVKVFLVYAVLTIGFYLEKPKTWLATIFTFMGSAVHREKTPVPPEPSVDASCVVYLLERVTVPRDVSILADAVDSLSDNSGAFPIAETLITFHLKPSNLNFFNHWRVPGLFGVNQRAILKMLNVLLVKWRYIEADLPVIPSTPSLNDVSFRQSLCMELWEVFLGSPGDLETCRSIHEIFVALSQAKGFQITWSSRHNALWDRVLTRLRDGNDPVVQKDTLRLLCTLPGLGGPPPRDWINLRSAVAASTGLEGVFLATMWVANGEPDLESFWMATLRVQILSGSTLDDLFTSRFSEYVATWFTQYGLPDFKMVPHLATGHPNHETAETKQTSLYWTYIFAIRNLLERDAQRWSVLLVEGGHLACLRAILNKFPRSDAFVGAPLALHSFLCLWKNYAAVDNVTQSTNTLLANDCAQAVADCIRSRDLDILQIAASAHQHHVQFSSHTPVGELRTHFLEDMGEMLDWLFAYLQAAIGPLVLDVGSLTSVAEGFSRWCQVVDKELSTDRYAELSERLRVTVLGISGGGNI